MDHPQSALLMDDAAADPDLDPGAAANDGQLGARRGRRSHVSLLVQVHIVRGLERAGQAKVRNFQSPQAVEQVLRFDVPVYDVLRVHVEERLAQLRDVVCRDTLRKAVLRLLF